MAPVLVAGLLAGSLLIQPAVAHLGSFKHLKGHFEQDHREGGRGGDPDVSVTSSAPVVSGSDTPAEGNYAKATAWRGEGRNNTYSEPTLTVSAICADPSK